MQKYPSVRPSLKYSCSRSPLKLAKGRTASTGPVDPAHAQLVGDCRNSICGVYLPFGRSMRMGSPWPSAS